MSKLRLALPAFAVALVLGCAATAGAQAPPPPTAANGQPVTTVATGVPTPTSFALDPSTNTLFAGAFGDEETGKGGGIYAIAPGGTATLVPGTPPGITGLAFDGGTLYASAVGRQGGSILALSQWNGTSFGSSKTIFRAARTVGAVGGLAWGPDDRLYAGAFLTNDVNKRGKAKKSPFPHPYTVFSIAPSGKGFKVVARGLRQPWQLTFAGDSPNPYVTVLSQEVGRIPADAIVVARPGSNFGFPACFLGVGRGCGKTGKLAKPFLRLPVHSSPMGIGAAGDTLYVALFGGLQRGKPEVVSIPIATRKPAPFLTGFAAPVVATNVLDGNLYAGDLTGSIYRVPIAG